MQNPGHNRSSVQNAPVLSRMVMEKLETRIGQQKSVRSLDDGCIVWPDMKNPIHQFQLQLLGSRK
ncbi:hypothetical protein CS542_01685 [Pedobacter sp. IW39]|nr:hypothetical protein CS542_01685 [Pedobacter sp. IW39]